MHGKPKKILEEFVTSATDSATSIVLVGSQALGNAHEDCDIDLIVLTTYQKDVEIIQSFFIGLGILYLAIMIIILANSPREKQQVEIL